ncbi:S-phase kinase-associated protein 1A [Aphelenchoides avenae]|nr:S-phase kinase-associated protein 1A [Aphelenchus avenae]
MSAPNLNSAAAPRQVACKTSDKDQVPVDLDVLLLSGTFKTMYDDLGLQEHDEFPDVFPVENVSSRIFKKVIDWCREHKDEPEPVIEKDPLTQECKWFAFTDYNKSFFDVPVPELFEQIKAANYLNITRLYHYACQSVAARIKGKSPREIGEMLQQDCDLDPSRIRKCRTDSPWLSSVTSGAHIEKRIFVPNEVLLTIFEKLPREDLERLQLVSTQFNDVIVGSSELSELQGPLRVVTKVEFGVYSNGNFSQRIHLWLRDGTRITCPDYKNLAKRLKFAVVQNLRAGYGGDYAGVQGLSALLPATSAWKNATVEAFFACRAVFAFARYASHWSLYGKA